MADPLHDRNRDHGAPDDGKASGGAAKDGKEYIHPDSADARTLFISGLPTDVQDREIHLIMRFFPGYEGCTIARPPAKQPIVFAVFHMHDQAVFVREALAGLRFDVNANHPLRIEFAHSNSKVRRVPRDYFEGEYQKKLSVVIKDPGLMPKKDPASSQSASSSSSQSTSSTLSEFAKSPIVEPILSKLEQPFAFSPFVNNNTAYYSPAHSGANSAKASPVVSTKFGGDGFPSPIAPLHHSPRTNSGFVINDKLAVQNQQNHSTTRSAGSSPTLAANGNLSAPTTTSTSNTEHLGGSISHSGGNGGNSIGADSKESTTLFIGNLNREIQRADLMRLFSLVPGMKELRVSSVKPDHPVAFAEFFDSNSAANALKILQGAPVGTTRLRIEYSRKKSLQNAAANVHHDE